MKKKLVLVLLMCIFSLGLMADEFYKTKRKMKGGGGAIEAGNILLDVYYGYKTPLSIAAHMMLEKIKTENEEKFNGTGVEPPNYTLTETGLYGGRFEYLLTDHIGLGVALMYEKITASATVIKDNNIYAFNLENTRMGAIVGLNVHFLTQENLDPYFLVGLGYMNYNTVIDFINPLGIPLSDEEKDKYKIPTPFAGRLALGARYFFTDNIGIKIEAGFGGGGVVEAGLAIKL